MTEQPFYIGQKVVSLIDAYQIKKGDVQVVLNIFWHCCTWLVDVGIKSPIDYKAKCKHGTLIRFKVGESINGESVCFAPVEEGFQAITFEKVMEQELASVN